MQDAPRFHTGGAAVTLEDRYNFGVSDLDKDPIVSARAE